MMNELEGTELPMKVPHDAKMTVLIHVVFLIFFFVCVDMYLTTQTEKL